MIFTQLRLRLRLHPIVGSNDPKPDPIYASLRLAFHPKCASSARKCIAQYQLKFQIIHCQFFFWICPWIPITKLRKWMIAMHLPYYNLHCVNWVRTLVTLSKLGKSGLSTKLLPTLICITAWNAFMRYLLRIQMLKNEQFYSQLLFSPCYFIALYYNLGVELLRKLADKLLARYQLDANSGCTKIITASEIDGLKYLGGYVLRKIQDTFARKKLKDAIDIINCYTSEDVNNNNRNLFSVTIVTWKS